MTLRIGRLRTLAIGCLTVLAAGRAAAGEVSLNVIQYPDKRSVEVPFTATSRAPAGASLEGDVKLAEGQARIELSYERLQPALLFGGNITSYVVWAVSSAGVFENLGELFTDEDRGSGRFQTGMKEFALFVTAEPLPGIWRPSDMVVFWSGPTRNKYSKNSTLAFSAFGPAVKHDRESIGSMRWQGQEPLELYQARKAVEAGTEAGLDKYDEKAMREARTTLAQATNSMGSGGSRRTVTDYARRTTALVTTAARAMARAQQEQAEAEAAARRKAEVDSLNQKAATAQQSAAAADTARRQAEEAERRANELRTQAEMEKGEAERSKAEMAAAAAALASQKSQLESEMAALQAQKDSAEEAKAEMAATAAALDVQKRELEAQMAELTVANERIRAERNALADRLVGALASVAETRNTARGVVVSLPDILFDTNKATLKSAMQVTLAKLAGVLSVFPNLNLRVEGYTDSTGTAELNDKLSKDRSLSVIAFLKEQGLSETRMTGVGYGALYPVASNDSKEGRAKNRRVEIVLAEGVVAAPAP
jgi:outer membrane protein OmpA-like peptidoglycan-associated protein